MKNGGASVPWIIMKKVGPLPNKLMTLSRLQSECREVGMKCMMYQVSNSFNPLKVCACVPFSGVLLLSTSDSALVYCMLILKPMIDDLKQLSTEGFIGKVSETEHKVYAAIATFSADNLSAHMIGGFCMCLSFRSNLLLLYGNSLCCKTSNILLCMVYVAQVHLTN